MPRRAAKKPLSHDRIVRVAVKYAARHGIDGLSMRTLAKQMDTGPMSLYHYFPSKDELLDAMVEWVAGKILQPPPGAQWREAVTEISLSAHQSLMQHGWVSGIWSKRKLGPKKLAFMESILRTLREGGFSVALACDAYHALIVHIEGFTLQAVEFPIKAGGMRAAAAGFIDTVEEPEAIPYFLEHVQHHLDHSGTGGQFEMMLNMILDGFESRLRSERISP